jgi:hypothetical protein
VWAIALICFILLLNVFLHVLNYLSDPAALLKVSNSLLIKVSNVQVKGCQEEMQGDEGLFQELKKVTALGSIAQSILEMQWKPLFSGIVVVRVNFLDDNLVVFDLDFLGRVTGKQ